jgi:hypothetical protein
MEGGTPVIVLADTAVAQQVVPPGEELSLNFGDGLAGQAAAVMG